MKTIVLGAALGTPILDRSPIRNLYIAEAPAISAGPWAAARDKSSPI